MSFCRNKNINQVLGNCTYVSAVVFISWKSNSVDSRNLRFSHWRLWRLLASWVWHLSGWCKYGDDSEEAASILKIDHAAFTIAAAAAAAAASAPDDDDYSEYDTGVSWSLCNGGTLLPDNTTLRRRGEHSVAAMLIFGQHSIDCVTGKLEDDLNGEQFVNTYWWSVWS
jgi:hypothetical protein